MTMEWRPWSADLKNTESNDVLFVPTYEKRHCAHSSKIQGSCVTGTTTRCEQLAEDSPSSDDAIDPIGCPKSNQPDGVRNWLHGCDSSTRAARSVSPVSYE